jgi:hypothetical protein
MELSVQARRKKLMRLRAIRNACLKAKYLMDDVFVIVLLAAIIGVVALTCRH